MLWELIGLLDVTAAFAPFVTLLTFGALDLSNAYIGVSEKAKPRTKAATNAVTPAVTCRTGR